MSKLGMEVLDRSEVSVLKIGEHPELISSESVEAPRYDVVVAADVIDRFEDPLVEFAKLFSLVEDDGVLICSSTIYDGGPLASRRHIFGGGRGSYYTPQSLRRIAAAHKFRVDFRLPSPSSKSGARRRYVIFSGSPEVMEHVGDYFARHQFPPTRSRAAKRSRSRRAAVPGDTRPSVLA